MQQIRAKNRSEFDLVQVSDLVAAIQSRKIINHPPERPPGFNIHEPAAKAMKIRRGRRKERKKEQKLQQK